MTDLKPNDERRRYGKNHFERYAERRLKLDYANLRFPRSELTFKTKDQDPRVWFTVKHIPERGQAALHLRIPVSDEWEGLDEFIDLDVYFPKDQLAEMMKVLTQPAKNERVMKLASMTITREHFEDIIREYLATRPSRQDSTRARSRRRGH